MLLSTLALAVAVSVTFGSAIYIVNAHRHKKSKKSTTTNTNTNTSSNVAAAIGARDTPHTASEHIDASPPPSSSSSPFSSSSPTSTPSLAELSKKPMSVNYHFHRVCNYKCGFCFHTNTNPFLMPLAEAQAGMKKLKDSGMRKVNFSGGEPFLHADWLGEMVRFCKATLGLESVTIVSNGSKVTEDWFRKYAQYLDILAISCDSFDHETNMRIGRGTGTKEHGRSQRDILEEISRLCSDYDVLFKINTVVCQYNWQEDMADGILGLNAVRWKVFQVLPLEGENTGSGAKKKVDPFLISTEQFESFVMRHRSTGVIVPESNATMQNSYLILDERMRFLDCRAGGKKPSRSVLEVSVEEAMRDAGFDAEMFVQRNGIYEWSKAPVGVKVDEEGEEGEGRDDSEERVKTDEGIDSWDAGGRRSGSSTPTLLRAQAGKGSVGVGAGDKEEGYSSPEKTGVAERAARSGGEGLEW